MLKGILQPSVSCDDMNNIRLVCRWINCLVQRRRILNHCTTREVPAMQPCSYNFVDFEPSLRQPKLQPRLLFSYSLLGVTWV